MATKAKKITADGVEAVETVFKNGAESLKDGFEKAAASYEQMVAFNKETAEAVIESATVAGKGFESINSEVFAYSKKSVEEGIAAAKAIFASKSLQEVLELQSEYTKSAFEAYVAEFSKMRDLALDVTKASAEPLQARAAAFADLVQTKSAQVAASV